MFPIQVKEYPGYNFIGMIFGPGSGTHKRFEKVISQCGGILDYIQGSRVLNKVYFFFRFSELV